MTEALVNVKLEAREDGGRIARVTVTNARRLNCLDTARIVKLAEAFERLSADDALRCVVLTGEGEKAFIGGADLNELGGMCADSSRLFITRLHKACAAIRRCPVPVIARVNGFCLGAGLEVAASCDMRVAAGSARFGMPEVKMGLPSVIEAALLPGLIGWGKTRQILLTGETFDAEAAQAMGFIAAVVPAGRLDAEVDRWLADICGSAPQAVRAQKALIDRWQRVSLEEGIAAGIDALSDAYKTGEPQHRIAAFFAAKRRK